MFTYKMHNRTYIQLPYLFQDLYSFLTQFFTLYPQYQPNDFYVFGESYAGKILFLELYVKKTYKFSCRQVGTNNCSQD